MFTGLVTHTVKVKALSDSRAGEMRLTLENPFERLESIASGESIAINGCCLTVLADSTGDQDSFECFVSQETLQRTALGQIKAGDLVNLERSLTVGARLGGHQVSGHIDAVGRITKISSEGETTLLEFRYPARFARLLVEKGSIAISGVSLTVNTLCDEIDDSGQRSFAVMIIPHTGKHTTLGALSIGDEVNLEFDMAAKYALRPGELEESDRAIACSETQTLVE